MFAASNSFDEKRPYSTSPAPGSAPPFVAPEDSNPGDFLIPANLPTSAPPKANAAAPPKAARKARAHHAISPGTGGLDSYFEEGEQKSREVDYTSNSSSGVGNRPPPPKALAPPKGPGPNRAKSPPQ